MSICPFSCMRGGGGERYRSITVYHKGKCRIPGSGEVWRRLRGGAGVSSAHIQVYVLASHKLHLRKRLHIG